MILVEHFAQSSRPQWRQWCFLVATPNRTLHCKQLFPSTQGGS